MANIGFQAIRDRVVFRAGETDFTWDDIARAAQGWGDWAGMIAEVRHRAACERRAKELGVMPGESDVQAAVQEFRMTRGLYKAADTTLWLERWGLSASAWMSYFRQGLARRSLGSGSESDSGQGGTAESSDDVDDMALLTFGVCSGRLVGLARKLAARAAAFEVRRASAGGTDAALDPSAPLERAEAAFEALRAAVVTPGAVRRLIADQHSDWIKVEARSAAFPDERMAREAILCATEDGEDLAAVVARTGAELKNVAFTLEDAEPALRQAFLSARPAAFVGPVTRDGSSHIYVLDRKHMPSEHDPELQGRAERILLQRVTDPAIRDHIHWRIPQNEIPTDLR